MKDELPEFIMKVCAALVPSGYEIWQLVLHEKKVESLSQKLKMFTPRISFMKDLMEFIFMLNPSSISANCIGMIVHTVEYIFLK